jgi:hypothetical protein
MAKRLGNHFSLPGFWTGRETEEIDEQERTWWVWEWVVSMEWKDADIYTIYKELHSKFLVIDRSTETVSWLTVKCIQCFNYNSFLGFFKQKMKSNLITLLINCSFQWFCSHIRAKCILWL